MNGMRNDIDASAASVPRRPKQKLRLESFAMTDEPIMYELFIC